MFEEERKFCTNDGALLVVDRFALPSDFEPEDSEEQTVIRMPSPAPQSSGTPAQPPVNPHSRSDPALPDPTKEKPKRGCLKNLFVLTIGLVLGAGIVLVALGIGFFYVNSRVNQEPRPKPTRTKPEITKTPRASDPGHKGKGRRVGEASLNGEVIARRAVVRVLPRKSSNRVDVIPKGDRIHIIRRRASNSPWYEIECEHGTKGWIHGNSIRFVAL
ncbi:MAG: SH3 domain-containing protein [Pyrinomonadaceae bacterium]|nr:SH3 domain-containing protein [Pyrinomonadaceae bacterium]